jgi:hypothetical protein
MILFLDEQNKKVMIYTESGLREVYFSEINALSDIIGNEILLYITAAQEVSVNDVVSLVYQITGESEALEEQVEEDKLFYLWSNSDKPVFIEDADIRFLGRTDFKLYDKEMKQKIKESMTLSSLVRNGKIMIVGESKKRILFREATKAKNRDAEKKQKKEIAATNSMMVDGPAKEFDPASGGDMISMDLTNDTGGGRTMTDLMNEIEETG